MTEFYEVRAGLREVASCLSWKVHTIPERRDQREQRQRRGEDSPSFDADLYRKPNVVEQCMGRLKQGRGVATRYEKRAVNYRAMVVVASLVVWLTA